MTASRFYSSVAGAMTLQAGITSTDTTIAVDDVTGLPTSYPYTLFLDYGTAAEEIVDVTNAVGTNLTVQRGKDGTVAQAHSFGAVIRHGVSGRDHRESREHEDSTAAHGVGEVVGTTEAQTLDQKVFEPQGDHEAAVFRDADQSTPMVVIRDSSDAKVAEITSAEIKGVVGSDKLWGLLVGSASTLYKVLIDTYLRGARHVLVGRKTTGATGKFLRLLATDGTTETFSVDADGNVAAANITTAAWTADTPTLYGSTTDPTLGTGSTAERRVSKVGKHVTATYRFVFGASGASAGSGYYQIALPSTPQNTLNVTGFGYYVDSDGFSRKIAGISFVGGGRYRLMVEGGGSGFVTNAVPWAWAAGDSIVITVTYEEA